MAFSCDILAVIQEKHTERFSLLTFSLQYAQLENRHAYNFHTNIFELSEFVIVENYSRFFAR